MSSMARTERSRIPIATEKIRAHQKIRRERHVCRGKQVSQPRPESEAMIWKKSAKMLLEDLRKSHGVEPVLGLPRPNSGLTVRLP